MDRRISFGVAGIGLLVGLALLGPFLLPDPVAQNRASGLSTAGDPLGPSMQFWLGTDPLGRDELSLLASAARVSLAVGAAAGLLATVIGTTVGLLAAVAEEAADGRGGRLPVGALLMRAVDAAIALPALLLAFALATVAGRGIWLVVAVVALTSWPQSARIVESRAATVLRSPFVEAARAVGVGRVRLLLRHVMPHALPVVLVYAALGFANAVLLEATLSYLGVGVQRPDASWGLMIYEGRDWFAARPLLLLIPGLAIVVTVLALTSIADAAADALDPAARARRAQGRGPARGVTHAAFASEAPE